ncbi:MAG: DUF1501 domain-containing protein [Gemmatimonadetes bacterium]|nr:DUF1501 domain-containing protein [Gemmatimonadota bacterium]
MGPGARLGQGRAAHSEPAQGDRLLAVRSRQRRGLSADRLREGAAGAGGDHQGRCRARGGAPDIGGWDTHANQGPTSGTMHTLMQDFSNSLGAFWADVMQGAGSHNVTVVVFSEFGRNARENGSQGTDHGRASVAFFMGQGIAGGRVMAQWPGLQRAQLEDGQDLRHHRPSRPARRDREVPAGEPQPHDDLPRLRPGGARDHHHGGRRAGQRPPAPPEPAAAGAGRLMHLPDFLSIVCHHAGARAGGLA